MQKQQQYQQLRQFLDLSRHTDRAKKSAKGHRNNNNINNNNSDNSLTTRHTDGAEKRAYFKSCAYLSLFPRYTDGNGSSARDSIRLQVTYAVFPSGLVDSGVYEEGAKAELAVEFQMYPEPQAKDFVWIVNEDEDDEVRIFPEESE